MILSWKEVALNIYEDIKKKVSFLSFEPKVSVILVWDNPSSIRYVKQKQKYAQYVWFDFELIKFDTNISQSELLQKINELNNDSWVSWFIVQLPLPKHINEKEIINAINPKKDIDWFHPQNQWHILIWDDIWLSPCTPSWVMHLCKYYNIDLIWKNVVIIWRSNIVWKPLANMMINAWATLTVCNSKTKNIDFFTKNADIVITALGVPKFLKKDMINKNTIVIDVWFTVVDDKIYWDADFEEILANWNDITPVPWWVWVLTVACLMNNVLKSI